MKDLPGWRDLPEGGLILEPGTSERYLTGDWRSRRPIWDSKKCIHCLICWIYCPDLSVLVENEKKVGIDYRYCKGCGICADTCPPKASAITMVDEEK